MIIEIYSLNLESIGDVFTYLHLILFPLFFILVAIAFSALVSSLIKGRLFKKTFQQFLLWSLVPSLFLGLFTLYRFKYHYRPLNVQHNESYRNFYGDERDESIRLAIRAVESTISNKGDYRIIRMRVLETDTTISGTRGKHYDIQQIYCLGKECTNTNTYAARQFVHRNTINNLFLKEPTQSLLGSKLDSEIESIVRSKTRNQSYDTLMIWINQIASEQVKLTE